MKNRNAFWKLLVGNVVCKEGTIGVNKESSKRIDEVLDLLPKYDRTCKNIYFSPEEFLAKIDRIKEIINPPSLELRKKRIIGYFEQSFIAAQNFLNILFTDAIHLSEQLNYIYSRILKTKNWTEKHVLVIQELRKKIKKLRTGIVKNIESLGIIDAPKDELLKISSFLYELHFDIDPVQRRYEFKNVAGISDKMAKEEVKMSIWQSLCSHVPEQTIFDILFNFKVYSKIREYLTLDADQSQKILEERDAINGMTYLEKAYFEKDTQMICLLSGFCLPHLLTPDISGGDNLTLPVAERGTSSLVKMDFNTRNDAAALNPSFKK